jgi:hypothetical protein
MGVWGDFDFRISTRYFSEPRRRIVEPTNFEEEFYFGGEQHYGSSKLKPRNNNDPENRHARGYLIERFPLEKLYGPRGRPADWPALGEDLDVFG